MQDSFDFSERLADAIRIEIAQRFFGERKDLEDRIQLFQRYVAMVQERSHQVADRVNLLRFVTVSDDLFKRFLELVAGSAEFFKTSGPFSVSSIPGKIPHAFTLSGRLAKIWRWVYEDLEKAIRSYNHGENLGKAACRTDSEEDLSYDCLQEMCKFINEEVERINRDLSASCTLEFVKNLDVERAGAECNIGGIGTMATGNLDKRLAFPHIEFDGLEVPRYPDLPALKTVHDKIVEMAKNCAATHHDEVRGMIKSLEQKIHAAAAA
jgi:hypothetical protein